MPRSLRALGISELVNDKSMSQAKTMKVACHNSVAASAMYQEVDEMSNTQQVACNWCQSPIQLDVKEGGGRYGMKTKIENMIFLLVQVQLSYL